MKKKQRFLFALLMAIVMMAMSPMRAWAQEADPRMAVFTELNGVTATFKDGNYPWGLTEHEGFDALTSTNQGENETTSETTIKLNCEQCIMLSFNYAVSCEDEFDLLTIVVDGETVVEGISGTESGVYEKLLDANGNGHTITMRYKKDDWAQDNDDCGYIYNIKAVADAHQHQFNDDYVCTLCGFRSRLAVFNILEGVTATFEDEGDYPWGLTRYIGHDALMSTNQGKDGTTSKTTIKLACDQAIDLQFSYKTSSEAFADYLIISVDGNEVVNSHDAEPGEDGITTVVDEYASILPANANGHTITMSYIKDNSSSGGDDYGFIYLISAYTHQHYYNATSCDWSEDNTSATLHLECECGETADVEATTITRTEEAPTCVKDGFCTITASAAYNGKTVKDSKTETFAALGHDWQVQSDGTYACQREGCTAQSATFPIEVIESSGGFEGEGPENLFDGDPNTKWCGSDVENESNSFYVIFKPSKPSVLVSYSLVDAEDTQDYYNRGWSSWDIQGTNDPNLALWESISSENGYYQGSTFTTGNTTAYTYYMITFSVVRSEDINGEKYLQQMADMNITWCTKHQWGEDHKCSVCGYECQHSWDDGVCELCGYECQHDYERGEGNEGDNFHICTICQYVDDCTFEDGICTGCGYECEHKTGGYVDGHTHRCSACKLSLPHIIDEEHLYYSVYTEDGDCVYTYTGTSREILVQNYDELESLKFKVYSLCKVCYNGDPNFKVYPEDFFAEANYKNIDCSDKASLDVIIYKRVDDEAYEVAYYELIVSISNPSHEWENGVCSRCHAECEHDFTSKTLTAEPDANGLYAYVCDREGCEGHSDYNVVKSDGDGNTIELTATTDGETTTYTATDVTIEDGKAFSTPVAFTVPSDQVTVERTFTVSKPATVMLPFSIEASLVQGATFSEFGGVSYDAEKAQWVATMTSVSTTLQAYKPYIVMLDEGNVSGKVTFDNKSVDVATFAVTPAASTMQTADENGWTFQAVNAAKTWGKDDPEIGKAYGFAGKDKTVDGNEIHRGDFVRIAAGASAKPGRCYLVKEGALSGASNAPARAAAEELPATIVVRFINGDTLGIGTLNTETGEFSIEGWYDLNGNKIEQPSKGGVYINNNKKVMVK